MIDTVALRKKVIDLAIQGKLTQQLPEDGNAEDLYIQIQEERAKLIKEGKIKKEKPLPEITDDEIPFEIPSNWKWCRLGEVYCVLMGQSPDGMNVGIDIDGIEFHQGKIYFGEKYLNQSEQKTCELTRIADANSVLLCVRAPVGVVNITERQICIGRGLCALTAIVGMEPLYLFYYLLSCRKSFEQSGTGSTFSSITVDVVKKHIVPLPPIEEQRRIVGLLDKIFNQFTVIDDLQQEFESNREILKGKIIDASIRGMLTEQLPEDGDAEDLFAQIQAEKAKLIKDGKIKKEKPLPEISDDEIPFELPDNWKWVRIKDISYNVWAGRDKPSDFSEIKDDAHAIPVVGNGVNNEGILGYTSEATAKANTITVAGRGTIGYTVLRNKDYCPIIRLVVVEPVNYVDPTFFYYTFKALPFNSVGSSIPQLTVPMVIPKIVPLPPFNEQKRISDRITELLSQIT